MRAEGSGLDTHHSILITQHCGSAAVGGGFEKKAEDVRARGE
jgi:hypothetical protein